MEEFQSKIKSFSELLQYVFVDFFEKGKKLFLLFVIIIPFEALFLFLINKSWLGAYLIGGGDFWTNFLSSGHSTIIASVVVMLFALAFNFSIVVSMKEDSAKIKKSLGTGFVSVLKILIPVALLGGIISEFFLLSSFKNIIVIAGFAIYFWMIFAVYVVLKEKRIGTGSFVRALYVLKRNFFGVGWKILIFFFVFFLSSIALTFPFISLYLFVNIPHTLGLIMGLALISLYLVFSSMIVNLYLCNLCENVWKMRKHIAFNPPPFLYNLAVNIFLLVVFLILILATIVIG